MMEQSCVAEGSLHPNDLLIRGLRGVSWVTASNIVNTIIRMSSKLILAWLLSPRDFGVVGLAAVVVECAQRLSETGFGAALVQKEGDTEGYLHTAWTIQVIRGVLIFLAIFFVAPIFVSYCKIASDSQNVLAIVRVLAFCRLIEACASVGLVHLEKEIHFRNIVICQFSGVFSRALFTVFLAFIFRNVWALVFGTLAGSIATLLVSYLVHPYRPRISLSRTKTGELFGYGRWVFSYTLISFLVTRFGDFFVAKTLGITGLGLYQMAFFISMIVKNHFSEIICRILFPSFSRIQQDSEKLRKAFMMSLEFTFLVFLPVGIGMALVGDLFVKVCLSPRWLPITKSLQILSIAGVFLAVVRVIDQYFKGVGLPKVMFYQAALEGVFIVGFIFPLAKIFGLDGVAITIALAGSIHLLVAGYFVIKRLQIKYSELAGIILPSAIGVGGTSIAVLLVRKLFSLQDMVSLVVSVTTGALAYVIIMIFLDKIANTGPLKHLQIVKKVYLGEVPNRQMWPI